MMNVAPLRQRLPRHLDIAAGDRIGERRIPFVLLRDVRLQHRDADRSARVEQRRVRETRAAPRRTARHHDGDGDRDRDAPAVLPDDHIGRRCALVSASRNDRPYTPVMLASWAIASQVIWL